MIAILVISSSFAADILRLNNDQMFEGEVKRIRDCEVIFKTDGQRFVIPASDIHSIVFEDPKNKVYTNYMQQVENQSDKCMNGRLDAETYHGKKGGHFVLGVLFGPFAMIGTALANPTPDKGARTYMLSQNKDQFSDPAYLSCYKKKAKGQLIGMEALGWGAWVLIILLI